MVLKQNSLERANFETLLQQGSPGGAVRSSASGSSSIPGSSTPPCAHTAKPVAVDTKTLVVEADLEANLEREQAEGMEVESPTPDEYMDVEADSSDGDYDGDDSVLGFGTTMQDTPVTPRALEIESDFGRDGVVEAALRPNPPPLSPTRSTVWREAAPGRLPASRFNFGDDGDVSDGLDVEPSMEPPESPMAPTPKTQSDVEAEEAAMKAAKAAMARNTEKRTMVRSTKKTSDAEAVIVAARNRRLHELTGSTAAPPDRYQLETVHSMMDGDGASHGEYGMRPDSRLAMRPESRLDVRRGEDADAVAGKAEAVIKAAREARLQQALLEVAHVEIDRVETEFMMSSHVDEEAEVEMKEKDVTGMAGGGTPGSVEPDGDAAMQLKEVEDARTLLEEMMVKSIQMNIDDPENPKPVGSRLSQFTMDIAALADDDLDGFTGDELELSPGPDSYDHVSDEGGVEGEGEGDAGITEPTGFGPLAAVASGSGRVPATRRSPSSAARPISFSSSQKNSAQIIQSLDDQLEAARAQLSIIQDQKRNAPRSKVTVASSDL